MKTIYVDELPKKGGTYDGCPYAVCDGFVTKCPFQIEKNGDHLIVEVDCIKTCPLKSTSKLLAEERKKVVQEIKKQSVKHPTITIYAQGKEFGSEYSIDETVLDQIERGDDTNVDTKNN